MKTSPTIRVVNAATRLRLAREACVHWDEEVECDDPTCNHECCFEVNDAKRELRNAKRARDAEENPR